MFFGIAPAESEAKSLHDKWENPLKMYFHYRELMSQGKTKSQIARISGISRARVTQIMNLLNLHSEIQNYLSDAKHGLNIKLLAERRLRDIAAIQNSEDQLAAFRKLIS